MGIVATVLLLVTTYCGSDCSRHLKLAFFIIAIVLFADLGRR